MVLHVGDVRGGEGGLAEGEAEEAPAALPAPGAVEKALIEIDDILRKSERFKSQRKPDSGGGSGRFVRTPGRVQAVTAPGGIQGLVDDAHLLMMPRDFFSSASSAALARGTARLANPK